MNCSCLLENRACALSYFCYQECVICVDNDDETKRKQILSVFEIEIVESEDINRDLFGKKVTDLRKC